ncbi:MAG: diguanylate cyclase [Fuerstiella sp.]
MPVSTSLPSMPGAVLRLLQVFSDPEVSVDDVVDILRTDPALASRILKAANSSMMGASRPTSELKRAAMMLGKKTVTTLALSFSLEDRSLTDDSHSKLFNQYWIQSFVTGITSAVLAKKYRCVSSDEAFVVGLLSRVGRLGALTFAGDQYAAAMNQSEVSGREVDRVQLEKLEASCEQLTQTYLEAWKLPEQFRDQISAMTTSADEDRTGAVDRRHITADLQPCELFRIASAVGNLYVGENAGIALAMLHELLEKLGEDTEHRLDELMAEVLEEFSGYSDMLDMPADSIGSAANLRERATSQLIEITIRAEAPSSDDEEQRVPASPDGVEDRSTESTDEAPSEQMHSEMDWLRRRVEDLARQLTIDPMTKVFNRQYFDRHLESVIVRCRASELPASVLFVDVNKFKTINDTFGHQVGDSVICSVADALAENVREDDIVARYGGDEFVVLCQTTQLSGLDAQATRLDDRLQGLSVNHEGQELPISLAIGGATGIPGTESDFDRRLLHEADLAMYDAKQAKEAPVVRILGCLETFQETPDESMHSASLIS